jgi:hypothetical protein
MRSGGGGGFGMRGSGFLNTGSIEALIERLQRKLGPLLTMTGWDWDENSVQARPKIFLELPLLMQELLIY